MDTSLEALDGFLRAIWLECCGHMSQFEIRRTRYSSAGPDQMLAGSLAGIFDDFGDESMDVAVGDVLAQGEAFQHEYDMGTTTELELKVAGCWPAVSSSHALSSRGSSSGTASTGAASSGDASPGAASRRTASSGALSAGAASSRAASDGPRLRIAGKRRRRARHDPKTILLLARNDPHRFDCVNCGAEAVKLCPQCGWNEPAWYCSQCGRKHQCGHEFMMPIVNSPRMGMCAYVGEHDR
ncbi:MAG: hypothetical protein IT449_11160 [Phycisphaerales bacterium]|nr:hypothetical protein [Phycisphaerales bacterium]